MADIRRNQGRLQEAHERSKLVTRSEDMKRLREQMQGDINAVSKSADGIKKRLAELDRGNEQVGGIELYMRTEGLRVRVRVVWEGVKGSELAEL